jgi:hypothetical protein
VRYQLDIVAVIINDSKAFLDELCQVAPFNMLKIHVLPSSGGNQPKIEVCQV